MDSFREIIPETFNRLRAAKATKTNKGTGSRGYFVKNRAADFPLKCSDNCCYSGVTISEKLKAIGRQMFHLSGWLRLGLMTMKYTDRSIIVMLL